jgi:hypothetical protein
MPSMSKSQYRLFKAIENGDLKKEGISKEKAAEFTRPVETKEKFKKLKERFSKKK